MSTEQLELNVLIEKIRSNDTLLGSELKARCLLLQHGMNLCFTFDHDWLCFGL